MNVVHDNNIVSLVWPAPFLHRVFVTCSTCMCLCKKGLVQFIAIGFTLYRCQIQRSDLTLTAWPLIVESVINT